MRKHWKFLIAILSLALVLTVAGAGVALARGNQTAPSALSPDPDDGLVIVVVDDLAADAGIVRGDVLLEVDGQAVNDASDWAGATSELQAGDRITLLIRHGDDVREVEMTVAERNDGPDIGFQLYFEDAIHLRSRSTLQFGRMFTAEAGVEVVEVTADSPAESAGLETGDRIIALDGRKLDLEDDFAALIAGYEPGDDITLTVLRDGEEQEIEVTLGEHPDREGSAFLGIRFQQAATRIEQMPFSRETMPFGRGFESIAEQGALVGRVVDDSPASAAGLRAGDIVIAAGDQPVETAQDLIDILADRQPGDTLALEIKRAGREATRMIDVELGEHPEREGAAYLGVELGDVARSYQTTPDSDQPEGFTPEDLFRFFQGQPDGGKEPGFRLPFDLPFELPFDLEDLQRNFNLPDLPQLPDLQPGDSLDL